MNEPRKLYWDSSCFICFLNADEKARREICEDILEHARLNAVEIWTSTYTIAEVIRPRRPGTAPLPAWAVKAIEAVEEEFPEARRELETLWKRYQSANPSQKLSDAEISQIEGMFEWEFVKKIDVTEIVAKKAVELSRSCGLKPPDAVQAASAIVRKADVLQRWDRDFSRVSHLITVEEPQLISVRPPLFAYLESLKAQKPEDLQDAETRESEREAAEPIAAELSGSGNGLATGQATAAPAEAATGPTDSAEGTQGNRAEESGNG